jgi:phosphoglycerate dehydrogenase-like enzyme
MRERTPLTREILQQLPKLKLIASTGPRNASIETQTAADLGIAVTATGYDSTPTIEFTWSLILASMRGIDREAVSLRAGGWQTSLGSNLRGKSLGVVGLGNIGREVARIGLAFGMKVIAWSQNLTEEKAGAAGATLVGTVPRGGCRHGPSRPRQPHQRANWSARVRPDEAERQVREYITGSDRR